MSTLWTAADAERANARRTGQKPPQEPRTPLPKGKTQPEPREPAEKHVQLPPAPKEAGPWQAANWTIRRATAYEPTARVYLVGPSEEFEQLLAHLKAFKP